MLVSNRNLLFQRSIFRFHVKFQGCTSSQWSIWVLWLTPVSVTENASVFPRHGIQRSAIHRFQTDQKPCNKHSQAPWVHPMGLVYLQKDKDAGWKKQFPKNRFFQIYGGFIYIFMVRKTMVQSATIHLKTNKMKSTKLCQSSSSDPPAQQESARCGKYGDRCRRVCSFLFFWGGPKSMNISYTQNHHLFVYTSSKVEQLALPKMRKDWKTNSFPFFGPGKFSVAMSVKLPWAIFDFFRKIRGSLGPQFWESMNGDPHVDFWRRRPTPTEWKNIAPSNPSFFRGCVINFRGVRCTWWSHPPNRNPITPDELMEISPS